MNWGLHVLLLNAEEFIISRNGRLISKPPLSEENSVLVLVTTFKRLLVLMTLSSPRGCPYMHLEKASLMY